MATLIKKGRKASTSAPSPSTEVAMVEPEPQAEEATSMGMAVVGETNDVGMTYSPPTPPSANMPRSYGQMSGYDVGATYSPPSGAGDFQLPGRYIPAEPPPSPEPSTGKGGLLSRVLLFTGENTAAERDRVAAEEFERAIAPVMEYMRANVPEASTPEEAARIWAENQGEITPDPKGGSFVAGDAFDRDARIYYRLLNRDYEKNPRPSLKRKESRALSRSGGSDGYRMLPATRGW